MDSKTRSGTSAPLSHQDKGVVVLRPRPLSRKPPAESVVEGVVVSSSVVEESAPRAKAVARATAVVSKPPMCSICRKREARVGVKVGGLVEVNVCELCSHVGSAFLKIFLAR